MRLGHKGFCRAELGLLSALLLTGCGAISTPLTSSPVSSVSQGAAITGSVHGGQQPIAGARVYLFAAGTSGYGAASTSLLSVAVTGHSDSVGAYVLTDGNGNFALTGGYTCTSGTQVYLYSLGGNPGAGVNSASGLMAVLGNCPASGTLAAQTPIVLVNEISTVAAAYAFAGFAVDATHVSSSGTTLAQTGIANAFANAAQLYNIADSKQALATTPNGNGTVPRALIHTLANILAACINTSGPASTPCSALFANAKNGSTTPTDTATAAINIAHNPWSNVGSLFALDNATAPFQPHLSVKPADFSITLTFSSAGFATPSGLAVDAGGSLQVANYGNASISKISPTGAVSTLYNNSLYLNGAFGIAIDSSGKSWTTASNGPYMVSVSAAGSPLVVAGLPATNKTLPAIDALSQYYTGAGSGSSTYLYFAIGSSSYPNLGVGTRVLNPYATAVDTNNFSWTTSYNQTAFAAPLLKFKFDGNYSVTSCTGSHYASGSGVAIDRNTNVWVSDSGTGYLTQFANSCAEISSLNTGSLNNDVLVGLAMDGNNNIWTLTSTNHLVGYATSGTALSGTNGYVTGATGTQLGPVVDGSGNVWFSNATANSVSEMIGVAAPVITPLSAAVAAGTMATRP